LARRVSPAALSILAASDPGGLMQVPRMYMRKMAVGPVAKGRIDLRRPVGENLEAIADAFGRKVADVTAIVLDRPRHDDLIAEIRESGARIKLISDGDIVASISAAIRGTNDHLAIGIGGAPEGIIAAAALSCLGGAVASLPLGVWELATTPLWPTPLGWALLVYLGVLVTFFGFGVWFWGLRALPAARAGALMFLQPVSGLVLAGVLLGDRPTPTFLLGCGLVLAGVYLAVRRAT